MCSKPHSAAANTTYNRLHHCTNGSLPLLTAQRQPNVLFQKRLALRRRHQRDVMPGPVSQATFGQQLRRQALAPTEGCEVHGIPRKFNVSDVPHGTFQFIAGARNPHCRLNAHPSMLAVVVADTAFIRTPQHKRV